MVPPERRALLATLVQRAATPGTDTLLVGEPGTGRSLLLGLAVQGARDAGVLVLATRAATTAGRPFDGVAGLLRAVPGRAREALRPEHRETVAALLDRPTARQPSSTAVADALAAVLRDLLADSPVCLAVDDRPQLDPQSATVLRGVLDEFAGSRPAPSVLATQRLDEVLTGVPDRLVATSATQPDVLTVPPLSVGALATVLRSTTGQRWDEAGAGELHRATGGNPRWATELGRQQLAHLPGHVGVQLPASVRAALGTRLAAAPDRARYALTVVAALGSADPSCVLALLPGEQVALVEARDAGLLRWTAGRLEPAHAVLGTAALATLGHGRVEALRRELYAELGRCGQPPGA